MSHIELEPTPTDLIAARVDIWKLAAGVLRAHFQPEAISPWDVLTMVRYLEGGGEGPEE